MKVPLVELEIHYARSSGPGGQNVNKVNSKCNLRWQISSSPSLSEDVRARFLERFASRMTVDGALVISSDRFRDQKRNFEDCISKTQEMLNAVLYPPKKRRHTKPTRASKTRRLDSKHVHSLKKASRRQGTD